VWVSSTPTSRTPRRSHASRYLLDRVGRVDDDRDTRMLVTDDVRPTAEVVVDELFEQHVHDATNGCGYMS